MTGTRATTFIQQSRYEREKRKKKKSFTNQKNQPTNLYQPTNQYEQADAKPRSSAKKAQCNFVESPHKQPQETPLKETQEREREPRTRDPPCPSRRRRHQSHPAQRVSVRRTFYTCEKTFSAWAYAWTPLLRRIPSRCQMAKTNGTLAT